jgi:hypothetical protein
MPKLLRFGRIERLARQVAFSGRVHLRIEITKSHIDPKRLQAAAERAVATARIKRNWR